MCFLNFKSLISEGRSVVASFVIGLIKPDIQVVLHAM